ncbi:MAG: HEAT repeat domain-containing protein [Gemmatimonadetes bacterium]|nr:HEAT repeat domain-containing protein [Gemmatimonadota bacterium]
MTMDTLTGGTVVVRREQIAFTTVRSADVEIYELRARETPPTVEAHWELAEWCSQQRLRSQREEQLEQILVMDPDHEPARKALGHVLERGEWMTREEQMASRGYYLHNGRWVTQQELDLLEKSAAQRAAEKEWFSKVYAWVRWVAGTNERQRQQGVANLSAITDPSAVAALTSHMSDHELTFVRQLMVKICSEIPGPEPVRPLVRQSLYDRDGAIRELAFAGLREDQYEHAVSAYVAALRDDDNDVINRAGGALGKLADPRVVPALIDALVTKHTYQVQVPADTTIRPVASPQGATWSDPSWVSPYLPPNVELALRTGQLPFGVKVIPPPGARPQMRMARVQVQMQNAQVLGALEALTGQHFGYDERTWKLWWAAEGQKVLSKV